jgi:hypothetical protein
MAAVDLTVEVDSTAEATGNRSLFACFTRTAGAEGCQPFFFSCERFTPAGDTAYCLLRNRWYTEGAPAKHQIAVTGSQIAHPKDDP